MDDLNCTPEQKLKRSVSLLRDEAYQWWLIVKEGTQVDRLTWEFFKTAFQGKYVGTSYVDARRREFLNLTQGEKSVPKYEAEFLQLSRYARRMVAVDYEWDREQDFPTLVEKAKIAEEVKRTEHLNRGKGRNKRDSEPSSSVRRPKKSPEWMGWSELGALLLLLDRRHVLIMVDAIMASAGKGLGHV
ncbi:uncharacterized protein [Gossypium hirsutum]|uniref:Retrotransposon gag domain-containing protein n=1 Tax=Gossypium hirsutum TaxID=3635 RepID=A0A1U8IZ73_GOSHI|nr:uncharacterized protein LOC107900034 [Gossypium hirsutum]